MAGHALGAADPRVGAFEQATQRTRLEGVTLRRGGGVGIHVVDVCRTEFGVGQRALHGHKRAFVAGLRYAASVARKAISDDFAQDVGSARHGAFVTLDNQCRCPTAGHESVAVAVERAGGASGFVHALGKGTERIEGGHGIFIDLLRTATEHHVLQSLPDEEIGQTDGVATAGAGCAHGEVGTSQAENGAEVHRDGRIHGPKDETAAEQRGVVLLAHDFCGLDDGGGRRIVAKDASHLAFAQLFVAELGHLERLASGHVGIFSLLGQAGAHAAVEQALEHGAFDDAGEGGLIAIGGALGIDADA